MLMNVTYKIGMRPNLCNILLYNTELHKFDFSMMPEKLKLNPQLQDIYKMQNFTINKINSPLIGQAFMDVLSGQDKFQYISGDYELKATTENFLPVMNYLFGSTANSLKEFAEQFSDEKRQIQITLEPADDNRLTCIVITLQQPEKKPSIVELHFTPDHAEISAECLNSSKTLRTSGIEFQQLLDLAYDNRYKYPSLLPVVCDTLKMAYKVFHFKAEECLYYPFIHFFPQNAEDACYFLDAAIPLLTRIPQLESYCEGLISKFDSLIYSAVYMGKKASVEFILARGGVKAIQGEMHGRSLLCIAAFTGDLDIVKILIEKGANPNEVMPDGETPLTLAIDRSNHDVVAYLKAEQAKNHRHTNAEVTRAWVPSMRL